MERHFATAAGIPEALTHNDPGLVHVLGDDGRITGIIDWTDACVGDPAKDFVGVLARGGWRTVRKLASTYGSMDSSFEDRLAFYAWLAPFHDILYGLDTGQAEYAKAGVEGVEKRMQLVGLLGGGPNAAVR
jgi:aminoglycoside phosphotransferase (APT) family kinase protein